MRLIPKLAAAGILAALAAKPATAQTDHALTQLAQFDHQVTGVSVTPDGRRFVNFPRWTDDAPVSVAEVTAGGKLLPYPDVGWNSWRNAKSSQMSVADHFVCVQSVVADTHGHLWVLDPGAPGNEKILPGAPKLVRIDLATNTVGKVIPVPSDVALEGTYLNDIRFSPDGSTGYITDSGTRGAIIVVDLESGKSFRALDGHPSTQIEKDVTVTIGGKPLLRPDGRQPAFAADGIALSNDGKTLFWQALTRPDALRHRHGQAAARGERGGPRCRRAQGRDHERRRWTVDEQQGRAVSHFAGATTRSSGWRATGSRRW